MSSPDYADRIAAGIISDYGDGRAGKGARALHAKGCAALLRAEFGPLVDAMEKATKPAWPGLVNQYGPLKEALDRVRASLRPLHREDQPDAS